MRKLLTLLKYLLICVLVLVAIGLFWGYQADKPLKELQTTYASAASKFIEIDGMNVHYRDEGTPQTDSIPLVLIHGTGASLHTWDGWVKELQGDFRLIRLDLPAYGLTGPNASNEYGAAYYASFLQQFLQKLNIKQCYIAGNSLGGGVAWRFAVEYPEVAKKLILIDAGGYPMGGTAKSTSVPIAFRIARMPVIRSIAKFITPRVLAESSLKNVYFDDTKITPELIDRYWHLTLREGNRAAFMARMSPKITQDSSWQKIKNINVPVLIQWGQHDGLITLQVAKRFQEDLPKDTLIVYPNAGHVPMEEIPQKTAQDAREFLKKP
jgi:pimeloyl-ACP methyl ester carboxylesterase